MTDQIDETADVTSDESDGILESGGPLDLADGKRGNYQLVLYLLAIPFWIATFWVLPIADSDLLIAGASVVGLSISAVAVVWLGRGIEERFRMSVIVFSIPFWFVVMWYASTQFMPRGQYGTIFLGWMLLIYAFMQVPMLVEQRKKRFVLDL